jgi:hypothetical protein
MINLKMKGKTSYDFIHQGRYLQKRTGNLPELPDRVCCTKRLALLYKVRSKTKDYATLEGVVLTIGVALEGEVPDGVGTSRIGDTKF